MNLKKRERHPICIHTHSFIHSLVIPHTLLSILVFSRFRCKHHYCPLLLLLLILEVSLTLHNVSQVSFLLLVTWRTRESVSVFLFMTHKIPTSLRLSHSTRLTCVSLFYSMCEVKNNTRNRRNQRQEDNKNIENNENYNNHNYHWHVNHNMLSIHFLSSLSITEIIGSSLLYSFFNDSVLQFPLTQKTRNWFVMNTNICLSCWWDDVSEIMQMYCHTRPFHSFWYREKQKKKVTTIRHLKLHRYQLLLQRFTRI